MEPILVGSHIQVDYVSLLKGSSVWDSMTDNLIHRGTATPWEAIVVQRRGVGTSCDDKVMDNSVYLFRGDSWLDSCVASIEGLSGDFADCSQL